MRRVTLKQKGEYELSQLNSHLFLDAVPLRLEHIFQDRASIKQGVIVFRVVQKVNTVYPRIGHLLKVFQSLFNILSLRVFNVSRRSVQIFTAWSTSVNILRDSSSVWPLSGP